MTIPLIRAALEKKLALLTPALSTAYENASFTPVPGTAFQRVNLLIATPDNSTLSSAMYREVGIFQVSLCYPQSVGPNAAEARAQLLRTHFLRGTALTEGAITVNIINTPKVSPPMMDGDRYVIPVSIPWQCYVIP